MKLKKIIFSTIFLFFISYTLTSQNYTISGYVIEEKSGEALLGANVYDLKSKQGTTTNDYGFYSLTLNSDTVDFVVSFVGFGTYNKKFFLTEDISLNIELGAFNQLSEIIITDKKSDEMVKSAQMSMIEMPIQQIKALPVLLGEADVLKALQLMPGIQSGSEGTSGIYVRGGGPDQNLILLDGVPVYNASHLFGFFSVFSPQAISNVQLIKGGFPARYGGRLSSVLDIRMKEGNMKEFHGEAGIGLISANLTLEGPIIKDKTSFIISARRTYIDVLAAPVMAFINRKKKEGEKLKAGYYFYDANIKINHKFSDKDRIFLSFYGGRDKAYTKDEGTFTYNEEPGISKDDFSLYWGNITGSFRWNHIFTNKLFANTTLIFSDYNLNTKDEINRYINNEILTREQMHYKSGIRDFGASIDFDYKPIPKHSIKFGLNYLYHTFDPGVYTSLSEGNEFGEEFNFDNSKIYANEFFGYIEDTWTISGLIKLNAGLHYSGFSVNDKYYHSLQPRASVRFLLSQRMSLKLGYSEMNQYVHLLTNSVISMPTDLWLPTTDKILPEKSRQIAIGAAYNIDEKYDFTLEGFYKTMNNLIEYKEGASFFQMTEGWESKIESGKGYSYGVEFLARKNFGKFTGWVGYTLSWAWRQFDNINFGKKFPYKYDRRHDISVVGLYKLNDNIDFGFTWVYGTGNAATLEISEFPYYYDKNEEPVMLSDYGERNSFRYPAYHRLDISANFHKDKKHGRRTWSFGIYNAYNRKNPFNVVLDLNEQGNKLKLTQISIFPIIPSIKYSFKF